MDRKIHQMREFEGRHLLRGKVCYENPLGEGSSRHQMKNMKFLTQSMDKTPLEVLDDDVDMDVGRSIVSTTLRGYQLEIFHAARQRNIVAYLETGSGKTLIAVQLMKAIADDRKTEGQKSLIIFFAPTVQLVKQQAKVIGKNTDLKIAVCYGQSESSWDARKWKKEATLNEVIVMTPQILCESLQVGYFNLNLVDLLVFDECHRATGKHPYAKIMEHYKDCQHKPKIFGMTASPLTRKGASSNVDCENQIANLEKILDSKVYTVEDMTEVNAFVSTPKQIIQVYEKPSSLHDYLKLELDDLMDKEIQSLVFHSGFHDDESLAEKTKKEIQKIHGNIVYCLEDLGLLCAYKAVQYYWNDREKVGSFLTDALKLFQRALHASNLLKELPLDVDNLLKASRIGYFYAAQSGLFTPKVQLLVRLIVEQSKDESMRCIIFVERVVVAAVISSMMQQLHKLSTVPTDYISRATSSSSGKKQQQILQGFSNGTVKLLVATDIVEEGIDVQSCSCVIRFDLPKTVRSFIQSRGRARQRKSNFILLVERDNEKQENLIAKFIKSEESMKEASLNRNSNHTFVREECVIEESIKETSWNRNSNQTCVREECADETDVYRVLSTGATLTRDSSVSLINKYCAKLPGDEYYSPKPEFIQGKVYEGDVIVLKLPPNAPFHEVISPPNIKASLAKQLVCFEACKRLHELGALDEYLQPVTEESSEKHFIDSKGKQTTTHAVITKRKELHSYKGYALSGTWGEKLNKVTLQVYKLYFTSQCNDNIYTSFAVLIEDKLDEDVAKAETDLFLPEGTVKSKILHCGDIELNSSQLKAAKSFHETLFTGAFAKFLYRDNKSKKMRLMDKNASKSVEMKKLWVSCNMYFILPIEGDNFGACQREVNIDWQCIRYCASGGIFFKSLFISKDDRTFIRDNVDILLRRTLLQYTVRKEAITLAGGIHQASDLIDKAIIAVHTGVIYTVVEVLYDKTAESPFPQSKAPKEDRYSNYCDYFEKKYGKKLKYVDQPLLRVKHTHRPYNLLTDHADRLKGKEEGSNINEANCVVLPPELCCALGVPSCVITSLYLVPSVMHRLNSLVLACQLRKVIREDRPKCPLIPATLIMEALTTSRCLESFSYERLELLGDSILKYVISCYLFLTYEKKDEGQLSSLRAGRVSNINLHKLAIARNLQEYIREEPFDGRRWVAPGMARRKVTPCRCNLENLGKHGTPEKEDQLFITGKSCEEGHRWMSPKTISDAVEALIGAHFVGGGAIAALEFMKWMNMEVDFEHKAACQRACTVDPFVLQNLHGLESLLGYEFQNKTLLVEAITHESQRASEGCYQRLEFVGDSVLDFLITRHFYSTYPGLSPGFLTDLRSAAVNNENFARAAAKNGIQKYLRHGSSALQSQITNFVKAVGKIKEGECRFMFFGGAETGPKVLGDMIESIAGAILLDMKFDFEFVWGIMKPILSPIVTPDTLELQPIRELREICDENHCNCKWDFREQGEEIVASVEVYFENERIVGTGIKPNKKIAKIAAAQQILLLMEERGLYHSRRNGVDKVTLETTSICSADEQNRCVEENAANVTEGHDESSEKLRGTTNADIIFKAKQVTGSSECVRTKTKDSVKTLNHKVALTTPICFVHEQMGGVLKNAAKYDFMEEPVAIKDGGILKVEAVTATNACVRMEEPEMIVPQYEGRKRKRWQDDPVCDSIKNSVNVGDVYLPRHLESTSGKYNKLITNRLFSVEGTISPRAKVARCTKEGERILSHSSSTMKPRFLEMISRTSEHGSVDKIDKVYQSRSHKGGLASSVSTRHRVEKNNSGGSSSVSTCHRVEKNNSGGLASSVTTCHRVEKNSGDCSQSGFSFELPTMIQSRGGPRVALHDICSKNKWPAPVYDWEEEGLPHNKRFSSTVHIPDTEFSVVRGEAKPTKKNAQDSAASKMLYELQKRGIL